MMSAATTPTSDTKQRLLLMMIAAMLAGPAMGQPAQSPDEPDRAARLSHGPFAGRIAGLAAGARQLISRLEEHGALGGTIVSRRSERAQQAG
jgi:hypothetical protein